MDMVATVTRPGLGELVPGIARVTALRLGPRRTSFAVADLLRANLPGPDLLTPAERAGSPETYVSHLLHAQRDFSISAVVWRPGQHTVIHDHVAWCAFGVVSGIEHETLYRDSGDHLTEIGRSANRPGEVSGFAPPGDIHRVVNTSDEVGISIHIYGADLRDRGSSVRRTYALPVR